MKLNATAEMIPVTWPEFSDIHPFAPRAQTDGYVEMIASLNADLGNEDRFDENKLSFELPREALLASWPLLAMWPVIYGTFQLEKMFVTA